MVLETHPAVCEKNKNTAFVTVDAKRDETKLTFYQFMQAHLVLSLGVFFSPTCRLMCALWFYLVGKIYSESPVTSVLLGCVFELLSLSLSVIYVVG